MNSSFGRRHVLTAFLHWLGFSLIGPLLQLFMALGFAAFIVGLTVPVVWDDAWKSGGLLFYAAALAIEILSVQIAKLRAHTEVIVRWLADPMESLPLRELKYVLRDLPLSLMATILVAAFVTTGASLAYCALLIELHCPPDKRLRIDLSNVYIATLFLCGAALLASFVRHLVEVLDLKKAFEKQERSLAHVFADDNVPYVED